VALRTMNSKKGDRMAFVTLDDRSGRIELAVFPESYKKYRDLLVKDKLLVVEGNVSVDDFSGGFRISSDRIFDINEARSQFAKRVVIALPAQQDDGAFAARLAQALGRFRNGACPVWVKFQCESAKADIALGHEWKVHPTDELLNSLTQLTGPDRVRVEYQV